MGIKSRIKSAYSNVSKALSNLGKASSGQSGSSAGGGYTSSTPTATIQYSSPIGPQPMTTQSNPTAPATTGGKNSSYYSGGGGSSSPYSEPVQTNQQSVAVVTATQKEAVKQNKVADIQEQKKKNLLALQTKYGNNVNISSRGVQIGGGTRTYRGSAYVEELGMSADAYRRKIKQELRKEGVETKGGMGVNVKYSSPEQPKEKTFEVKKFDADFKKTDYDLKFKNEMNNYFGTKLNYNMNAPKMNIYKDVLVEEPKKKQISKYQQTPANIRAYDYIATDSKGNIVAKSGSRGAVRDELSAYELSKEYTDAVSYAKEQSLKGIDKFKFVADKTFEEWSYKARQINLNVNMNNKSFYDSVKSKGFSTLAGFGSAGIGITSAIIHPLETRKAVGTALIHPVQTYNSLMASAKRNPYYFAGQQAGYYGAGKTLGVGTRVGGGVGGKIKSYVKIPYSNKITRYIPKVKDDSVLKNMEARAVKTSFGGIKSLALGNTLGFKQIKIAWENLKQESLLKEFEKKIDRLESRKIKSLTFIDEGSGLVRATGIRKYGLEQEIDLLGKIKQTETGFKFIPIGKGKSAIYGKVKSKYNPPKAVQLNTYFDAGTKATAIKTGELGRIQRFEELANTGIVTDKIAFGSASTLKAYEDFLREFKNSIKVYPSNDRWKYINIPTNGIPTNALYRFNSNLFLRKNPVEVGVIIKIPKIAKEKSYGGLVSGKKSSASYLQNMYNEQAIVNIPSPSSIGKTNKAIFNDLREQTKIPSPTQSNYYGLGMYERTEEYGASSIPFNPVKLQSIQQQVLIPSSQIKQSELTIPSYKTLSSISIAQKSRSKSASASRSLAVQGLQPAVKTETITRVIPVSKSISASKVSQAQTQFLASSPKFKNAISPIPPSYKPPKPPKTPPPKIPQLNFGFKQANRNSDGLFKVSSWRGQGKQRKEFSIGIFNDINKAIARGQKYTSDNLSRTFKVSGRGATAGLPKGYRLGKSKKTKLPNTFVQLEKYSLSSRGEKEEIKRARKKR